MVLTTGRVLRVLGYICVASTKDKWTNQNKSSRSCNHEKNIIGHRGESQTNAYMCHIPHLGDKNS